MKKKIIATISCALAVFAFTGCGQTASIAFNGSYWNKDTSNETPAGKEEIIEYGVYSVEENELWNKTQTNAVHCMTARPQICSKKGDLLQVSLFAYL